MRGGRGSVKLRHSSPKRHSWRTCPQFRRTDTQPASISALFRARAMHVAFPSFLSRSLGFVSCLTSESRSRESRYANPSVPKSRLQKYRLTLKPVRYFLPNIQYRAVILSIPLRRSQRFSYGSKSTWKIERQGREGRQKNNLRYIYSWRRKTRQLA